MLFYSTKEMLVITMESHHPSYPIVPWTGWTVPWNPSILKSHRPSYPIVPWTGWTVPWNPSIQSKHIKSHCPSYPIVPWTRWTVPWNPSTSQTWYPVRHILNPTVHPTFFNRLLKA